MKSIPVTCWKCNGRGHVPLQRYLTETYAALPPTGERTASRLATQLDTKLTAMIQRLQKLRALGLVKRRKDGREYRWSRAL